MKKRISFLLGIIVLYVIFAVPAFAGDVPEAALTDASNAMIGTVEKIEDTATTIKISKVLFGDYSGDRIKIDDFKFFKGAGQIVQPKVGDYCAFVVDVLQEENQENYKIYHWLSAKSDSLDPSTLKLQSNDEFIIRMNGYINNGWYSNDNRNRLLKRYDKISASKNETSKVIYTSNSNEKDDISINKSINRLTSAVIILMGVAAGGIVYLFIRKKRC